MPSRGGRDVEDVAADFRCDVHRVDDLGRLLDLRGADDRFDVVDPAAARVAPFEDRELCVTVRIAHRDAHQEAVELCLGERVRPFELDRVLGRDHHERPREPVGAGVDRDLSLFHRFEQRGLRLG